MNPKVSIVIPCPEVDIFTQESVEHCLDLGYSDFEVLLFTKSELGYDFSREKVLLAKPRVYNGYQW